VELPEETVENTRAVTWDDPHELGLRARELSGLEFLRSLIAEQRPVPIGMTLGFRLVEVDEGRAVLEAEAGPWAYNPIGIVHGGWYAAVLDAPLGCALHSTLPAGSATPPWSSR
jgi:acyl-coenzyme A thioesterase PaaI-like protein